MKYTIVLLSAIILSGLSCVKKSANVNCYACTQTDSVASNIPNLNKVHYISGVTCQLTKAQAQFYEHHTVSVCPVVPYSLIAQCALVCCTKAKYC